jgi:LysM repeat protein
MSRFISQSINQLSLAALAAGTLGICGCFYGPPPNYQQLPMQPQPQVAPTPVQPGTTFAPEAGAATTLDQIPDAAADTVLTVPQPRDPASFYEVKEGDSLSSIARQKGVTVDDLMKANSFDREQVLQPGYQLRIPGR